MSKAGLDERTIAVVTISDRCAAGTQVDLSGPAVETELLAAGIGTVERVLVSDDADALVATLRSLAERVDLVVTTGGTGFAARDRTPEATLAVCDRMAPGLAERMRRLGEQETELAALGRGVCGIAGACLVINLPGSPRGAVSSLRALLPLLPHALALLAGETAHDE
jgi:molybdenum cofactor synthesis domain-containing protein